MRLRDNMSLARLSAPSRFEGTALTSRLLIFAGFLLIGLGLVWMIGERFGLGRLPGDIIIERGNLRIYIPLATSLLLSVALSLLLWFLNR